MAFSVLEHDPSSTNNQGDPGLSRRSTVTSQSIQVLTAEIDSEFAYPDGNIELQVGTYSTDEQTKQPVITKVSPHIFRVHEFQLTKFVRIAELIRQARERGEVTADPERRIKVNIQCTGKLRAKDVRRTLQVIYSSFVSGNAPPKFDPATLVSALRVATLYQNPELRNFAISRLQSGFTMTPIYRISLADELSIPNWAAPAFVELCRRQDPLSLQEANVLGIARTVEVARLREAEQRHQYLGLVCQAATDPFLGADGSLKKDKLRVAAEQTSKHPSLSVCDCRVQNDSSQNDGAFMRTWFGATEVNYSRRNSSMYGSSAQIPNSGSLSVIPCQIHQLAPAIASESRALYKHLSNALGRLSALKQRVDVKVRGLPGSVNGFSVESEIKQASWIRKAP